MYGPMLRHCSLPMSCCEADAGVAAFAPIGIMRASIAPAKIPMRSIMRYRAKAARKPFLR
jgi:hypothetical protein